MSKGLMIFSLIGLLIVITIGIFIFKSNLKSVSQTDSQNGTENSALSQANKAKVQADLKSIETSLTIYFNIKNGYPNTSSFSSMITKLKEANAIQTEPEKPTQDYLYKYCSSSGRDFLLEGEYNNETIFTTGNASCLAGE